MKLSFILLFSFFFMSAFIPEATARHHCRSRTSFGLSFNVGGPSYAVAPAPVVAPAPIYSAPVYPAPAYVAPAPAYPYYYSAPVVVARPRPVYVQPGFSYSYWGY